MIGLAARVVRTVLVAGIVLLAVVTIVGGFFGTPMGLSYVQTDSMSPTLQPGDGFIIVPTELTGELASGDVVVFRAERLGGGGPTTHRIVAKTDRGYITQGDNNNEPDQAGGEPPVQQAQIIGEALRINGQLVVLPNVGLVGQQAEGGFEAAQQFIEVASWRLGGGSEILSSVNFTHGITLVFILLYVAELVRERLVSSQRDGRSRERVNEKKEQRESFHTIILVLTAVVVLTMTAAMVIPGGAQERGVVVSETSTPATADPGEEVGFNHTIGNADVIPMTVFLEPGEDLTLNHRQISLSRGEIANVSGTAFAPQSVGHHRFFVTEHWYFPLLPTKTIKILYNIHPWAPIVVIDAIVAIPYYLFGRHILYGGPPTRTRSRDRA